MTSKDRRQLENRIKTLDSALNALRLREELKALLLIIRRPGWTTPAELYFAGQLVEGMIAQVQVLGKLKDGLISGSRRVGRG